MGNVTSIEKRERILRRQRKVTLGKKPRGDVFKSMKSHGKSRYMFGYRIQQNWPSMWVLEHMLSSYRPDLIVELGTGMGLLSTYFSVYGMLAEHEVEIISLDLVMPKLKDNIEAINNGNTKILDMDIYAPETVKYITDKINNAERPFLLSDGKDPKSSEVNLYAKDLKEGVLVFAHDAILEGGSHIKWGYKEDRVDWTLLERCEPYYTWSVQGDTRMMCMRTKGKSI
jgi:cephalosporin hydroxylase